MSTPPTDGDDLRALLNDTVSDVEPGDVLRDIQARTAGTIPSPTRWLPLTIAAAAAVIVVLGGVVWFAKVTADNGQVAAPDGPRVSTSPSDDLPRNRGRDHNVQVYYVGATAAGPRLFSEYHQLTDSDETAIQATVDEAFGARPVDPDYRNDLRGLGVSARVLTDFDPNDAITLDLSDPLERPDGMSAETAEMVVQSLVWTIGAAASSELPVRFTVDSQDVDSVLGVDTTQPVARGSADSVLSTISIASPNQGSVVSSPFDVRGQAATFEANVVWELKQGDEVVRNGFTTATECCTLSPYTFSVDPPPGDYTLVVHDTDESDGEGIGTSQDTKEITVR